MKCPRCGSWSTVAETREAEHGTTRRRRVCANKHRFTSVELPLTAYRVVESKLLLTFRAISVRVALWKRNARMARDKRSAAAVAIVFGVHRATVNRARALLRAEVS
jgi:transcriptional regulator NrdR family protein